MGEWKEYRLGEIAEILDYKRIPLSSTQRSKRKGDFPYYGASGVIDHVDSYIFEGEYVLISEDGENLRSRQTPIAFITSGKFWVNNHAHILKSDFIHNRLICYYFANLDLNPFITGAVQPKLNQASLCNIPIYLPENLNERENIVNILNILDEKIDLLTHQNITLEKMAETLFRQWFIEGAKEDWKEGTLTNIADFLNGINCQKIFSKSGIKKLPILKIKELNAGITKDTDWSTTEVASEYIVKSGDVIFAWSASLMVKMWDGEKCILNQHLFKVTSNKYPKWFYLMWCKFHLKEFKIIAASHATTMGHIKRQDLNKAKVIVPNQIEMREMTTQMEPMINKIKINNDQIHTLTHLRDALLPKLMNGEITVK